MYISQVYFFFIFLWDSTKLNFFSRHLIKIFLRLRYRMRIFILCVGAWDGGMFLT